MSCLLFVLKGGDDDWVCHNEVLWAMSDEDDVRMMLMVVLFWILYFMLGVRDKGYLVLVPRFIRWLDIVYVNTLLDHLC